MRSLLDMRRTGLRGLIASFGSVVLAEVLVLVSNFGHNMISNGSDFTVE
jgi:hypothetical protein